MSDPLNKISGSGSTNNIKKDVKPENKKKKDENMDVSVTFIPYGPDYAEVADCAFVFNPAQYMAQHQITGKTNKTDVSEESRLFVANFFKSGKESVDNANLESKTNFVAPIVSPEPFIRPFINSAVPDKTYVYNAALDAVQREEQEQFGSFNAKVKPVEGKCLLGAWFGVSPDENNSKSIFAVPTVVRSVTFDHSDLEALKKENLANLKTMLEKKGYTGKTALKPEKIDFIKAQLTPYISLDLDSAKDITADIPIEMKTVNKKISTMEDYRKKRDDFAALTGKAPKIEMMFEVWSDTWTYNPFPAAFCTEVDQHGHIPMVTWGPSGLPFNPTDDKSTYLDEFNKQLANKHGEIYEYAKNWAEEAKEYGKPFLLRPFHEMNLQDNCEWTAWMNGGEKGIAKFKKAWQNLYTLFKEVGADNATFVWCPNTRGYPLEDWNSKARDYFPGAEYVDWLGVDGYLKSEIKTGSEFPRFATVFGATIGKSTVPKSRIVGIFGAKDMSWRQYFVDPDDKDILFKPDIENELRKQANPGKDTKADPVKAERSRKLLKIYDEIPELSLLSKQYHKPLMICETSSRPDLYKAEYFTQLFGAAKAYDLSAVVLFNQNKLGMGGSAEDDWLIDAPIKGEKEELSAEAQIQLDQAARESKEAWQYVFDHLKDMGLPEPTKVLVAPERNPVLETFRNIGNDGSLLFDPKGISVNKIGVNNETPQDIKMPEREKDLNIKIRKRNTELKIYPQDIDIRMKVGEYQEELSGYQYLKVINEKIDPKEVLKKIGEQHQLAINELKKVPGSDRNYLKARAAMKEIYASWDSDDKDLKKYYRDQAKKISLEIIALTKDEKYIKPFSNKTALKFFDPGYTERELLGMRASAHVTIADIYAEWSEKENAKKEYTEALKILKNEEFQRSAYKDKLANSSAEYRQEKHYPDAGRDFLEACVYPVNWLTRDKDKDLKTSIAIGMAKVKTLDTKDTKTFDEGIEELNNIAYKTFGVSPRLVLKAKVELAYALANYALIAKKVKDKDPALYNSYMAKAMQSFVIARGLFATEYAYKAGKLIDDLTATLIKQ